MNKLTPQHVDLKTRLKHSKSRAAANQKLLEDTKSEEKNAASEVQNLKEEIAQVDAAMKRFESAQKEHEDQGSELHLDAKEAS